MAKLFRGLALAAAGAGLFAPAFGRAPDQDPGWLEKVRSYCRSGNREGADGLRKELASLKDPRPKSVTRAVRSVLLRISIGDEESAKSLLRDLGTYLEHAAGRCADWKTSAGHRDAITEGAGPLASECGRWLALAHLDQYLEAGGEAATMLEALRHLKLKALPNGIVATPEGETLSRIKQIKDIGEIDRVLKKAGGSINLDYCRAILLIRSLESDPARLADAREAVKALQKSCRGHADALLTSMDAFTVCPSCKGSRKVRCSPCAGKGQRHVVCPECNGSGKLDAAKAPKLPGRIPVTSTICPTCINRPDVKERWQPCEFCEQKGEVQCQRCKWQKVTIESIGKIVPCAHCDGTGFPFARVLHPCAFCRGAGEFLVPSADPEQTIGPLE